MGVVTLSSVTTLHTYDAVGNEIATKVKNPNGILASSTVYNEYGQVTQVVDVLGAVTKYTQDNHGI